MTPIHANEVDGAVDAEGGEVPESVAEKGGEFGPIHLTRSHREGAMVRRPETAGMTVDRHVVGRVTEHHCGALLAHHRYKGRGIQRTAARDAMAMQLRYIPDLAD